MRPPGRNFTSGCTIEGGDLRLEGLKATVGFDSSIGLFSGSESEDEDSLDVDLDFVSKSAFGVFDFSVGDLGSDFRSLFLSGVLLKVGFFNVSESGGSGELGFEVVSEIRCLGTGALVEVGTSDISIVVLFGDLGTEKTGFVAPGGRTLGSSIGEVTSPVEGSGVSLVREGDLGSLGGLGLVLPRSDSVGRGPTFGNGGGLGSCVIEAVFSDFELESLSDSLEVPADFF